MKAEVKERRIFFFECVKCGAKRRCSFKKHRAELQVCRKCRRGTDINPNQTTLFGDQTLPPEPMQEPPKKRGRKKKEIPAEERARLHKDLVKLGDMIADGEHLEKGGKWISREYRKISKILYPEIK